MPAPANRLDDLETPAAVVDVDRMANNLRLASEYCAAHGLRWRPHDKTHKCRELGAAQVAAGAHGLTVATLREAEVMARVCNDLLLAYPPVGDARLSRLMDAAITRAIFQNEPAQGQVLLRQALELLSVPAAGALAPA